MGCGLELCFLNHLFGQFGYNFDFNESDLEGFTYGFGFNTPKDVNMVIPIKISIFYGNGIKSGVMDANIIAVSLNYDL